tara:strand:- start:1154 stop:2389 length:1236 start_codon:yes stop_codon:yes gene_type:complete
MADNIGGLTDTYINDLIQKKIQSRNSMPQVQAGTAQSALATVGGNTDIGVIMSGLRSIGQGIGGADAREIDQDKMNAAAEQQNFTNQQAADDSLFNMLQKRDQGVRQNAATQALTAKNKLATDNRAIQEATKQNTAKQQLQLQADLGGLYQKKQELGDFLNKGNAAGYLEVGTGGNDYTLTDEGRKDEAFAKKFGNRVNMADEMQVLQAKYQQSQTTAATDTDRLNDFNTLNVVGQAGTQFQPTNKATRVYQDKIASLDFKAQKEIAAKLGEGSLKNNAFTENLFNLEGTVVEAGKSALDSLRNESPEVSNEVNTMKNYAIGENTQFKAMPSLEQDYVLATFLKENGGVSESWLDLYNGKWSEDVVDQNFGKYVTAFTNAKIGVTDAKAIQTKYTRAKLGEQINFENSAGR